LARLVRPGRARTVQVRCGQRLIQTAHSSHGHWWAPAREQSRRRPSLTTYGIHPIDADGAATLGFCESWRKDPCSSATLASHQGAEDDSRRRLNRLLTVEELWRVCSDIRATDELRHANEASPCMGRRPGGNGLARGLRLRLRGGISPGPRHRLGGRSSVASPSVAARSADCQGLALRMRRGPRRPIVFCSHLHTRPLTLPPYSAHVR
jgi:hypothetical protein